MYICCMLKRRDARGHRCFARALHIKIAVQTNILQNIACLLGLQLCHMPMHASEVTYPGPNRAGYTENIRTNASKSLRAPVPHAAFAFVRLMRIAVALSFTKCTDAAAWPLTRSTPEDTLVFALWPICWISLLLA